MQRTRVAAADIADRSVMTSPASTSRVCDARWTVTASAALYVFSCLDRSIMTMMVPSVKIGLQLSDFQMSIVLGPA